METVFRLSRGVNPGMGEGGLEQGGEEGPDVGEGWRQGDGFLQEGRAGKLEEVKREMVYSGKDTVRKKKSRLWKTSVLI